MAVLGGFQARHRTNSRCCLARTRIEPTVRATCCRRQSFDPPPPDPQIVGLYITAQASGSRPGVARDQTEVSRGWIEFFPDMGVAGYVAGQDRLARGRNWSRLVRRHLPGCRTSGLAEVCPHCPWGPLFRRVTGQGETVGAERLNDQEVARAGQAHGLGCRCARRSHRRREQKFSGHSLRASSAELDERYVQKAAATPAPR